MRGLVRSVVAASAVLASVVVAPNPASGVQSLEYVTTSLRVGSTASEAASYGLDLNGDGRVDNALGGLLAGLAGLFRIDASIAESLAAGDTVVLHSLHAKSLIRDGSATWRTLPGKKLHGRVAAGRFVGGPGVLPLRLGLVPDAAPVRLVLVEARVDATCTPTVCNGRLGGGIPAAQVDSVVVPALAAMMQAVIDESCSASSPGTCSPEAQGLLLIFDVNGDFEVTADELRANDLLNSVLAPDLDLLKTNGKPGRDGVRDSLSLALGFTAVTAP